MALNVPMQALQPVTSLSDAVGKWTDINRVQQGTELAKQQEARLQNQNERENKLGDFKFATDKQTALKSVMTDVKSKMDDFTKQTGFAEGSPEFQQRLNAVYATNADPIMKNITGIPYKHGTNVEWQHVNSLAGMTPAEAQQQAIDLEGKKYHATVDDRIKVAEAGNQFDRQTQQNTINQQNSMATQKHNWDVEDAKLENTWKEQALETKNASSQINGRKPLTEYQAAQLQEKHDKLESDATDALQGIKSTKDELLGLKDLQDKVATGSIIGSDIAVGVRKMLPEKWGHGEDLNALQKGYATASLKAIGALKAGGTTLGAMSEKEGQWVRDAQASLNSTGTVNKDILDNGIALLDEREKAINKTLDLHRKTLDRVLGGEQTNNNVQQTQQTPQELPEGYEYATNPKTGEKIPVRKK